MSSDRRTVRSDCPGSKPSGRSNTSRTERASLRAREGSESRQAERVTRVTRQRSRAAWQRLAEAAVPSGTAQPASPASAGETARVQREWTWEEQPPGGGRRHGGGAPREKGQMPGAGFGRQAGGEARHEGGTQRIEQTRSIEQSRCDPRGRNTLRCHHHTRGGLARRDTESGEAARWQQRPARRNRERPTTRYAARRRNLNA